ncbi:hypothetical protein ACUH7A_004604 [Yersinia enterocolitica]|uniref:hypothetical protein n=1 Tax=Yersinia TaxID=629 RepID=UPI0005E9C391|nr:hypothetical protein [Yersinia intermedia]EKN6368127.1 hypothetical protein [Yersinia enterocolitica]ELI8124962.1 hypothetical protein [Yersinia enterocolitica]CNI94529.1 Uncharacterised protein [Yersinia intermedia]HEN3434164.1 hypothetical protein [Yersinia enterocolitica]
MSDAIRKKFDIPENHTLKEISMEWKGARKGRDNDEYTYEQLNENDEIVASYVEIHSTSTYPPFATSITVTKN